MIFNKLYGIYRYMEFIYIMEEIYNIYICLYALNFLCAHRHMYWPESLKSELS